MASKQQQIDVPTIDHATVASLIDEFVKSSSSNIYFARDLNDTPALQSILALEGKNRVLAAVALADRIRAVHLKQSAQRAKAGHTSQGANHWLDDGGLAMSLLLSRVMTKKLEYSSDDLAHLVNAAHSDGPTFCPFESPLVAALERAAECVRASPMLRQAVEAYVTALKTGHSSASVKLVSRLNAILNPSGSNAVERQPTRAELVFLKRGDVRAESPSLLAAALASLVQPADGDDAGVFAFSLTNYPSAVHSLVTSINKELAQTRRDFDHSENRVSPQLLSQMTPTSVPFACAMLTALSHHPPRSESVAANRFHNGIAALNATITKCLSTLDRVDPIDIAETCHALAQLRPVTYVWVRWSELARSIANLVAPHKNSLDDATILAVLRFRDRLLRAEYPADRASVRDIDTAIDLGRDIPVLIGEPWTDRAFEDLLRLPSEQRTPWLSLLAHARNDPGSKPTAKWLKALDALLLPIDRDQVPDMLAGWFSLVGKPKAAAPGKLKIPGRDSTIPSDQSADILRGLAFIASRFDAPRMAQALGDLAMACFKMVPGHGARCIKPGSSALWSLAQMTTPSALAQLSRLRQLVKFGTAKKMLDSSLDALAAKLGITTEQLHEIAAPDFGLSPDSTIDEEAGDYTLQLVAEPAGARIRIVGDDGKERKSVPEAVKKDHGETLKALKQTQADIDKMLEAQRARIDALFIADRTWPVDAWRERYITHPLVGVLGRRLIWNVIDDPKSSEPGRAILYRPDTKSFADLDGKTVVPEAAQHIKLWHPIFAAAGEVARWREVIESSNLRQPVKQAHREVYPLTDAERRTGSYSNRFAAHIIKQHAFQQLAADRGWKSKLRLMVDDTYPPPTRQLPSCALRAEFWIESVGDNFGTDTTESGSFLYLATDQVRFYRIGAAQSYAHAGGGGYETYGVDEAGNHPIPLEQIPPLVFSEIMRDVDLFVGGASVGNNADWQDGGPDGRFRDYWQSYSFGALSASGKARREFLERLVPRLKIAPQCAFEGDFLIVRGSLRTYKIHLGSGNILMKPNDQYLCIVPNSSFQSNDGPGGVFLPFDGDRTLSIILSKAFMLAEDTKIKDGSIISQIERS